jgi:hypothetical protein
MVFKVNVVLTVPKVQKAVMVHLENLVQLVHPVKRVKSVCPVFLATKADAVSRVPLVQLVWMVLLVLRANVVQPEMLVHAVNEDQEVDLVNVVQSVHKV